MSFTHLLPTIKPTKGKYEMVINEKALASAIRHFKGNAVVGLVVATAVTTVKTFISQGFKIGFNLPTLFVLGVAVAVAVVTVGTGILLKKRPDLAPEITFIEKKALVELNTLASQQIVKTTVVSPDQATGAVTTTETTSTVPPTA